MGACLYGFQLLQSRVAALFVAGTSRVFLICFGVNYWLVPAFAELNISCNAVVAMLCSLIYSRLFFASGTWDIVLAMQL